MRKTFRAIGAVSIFAALIGALFVGGGRPASAEYRQWVKYSATVGALLQGRLSYNATEVNHLKWTPSESGNTNWYEWYSNTANSSGARGDHVRISGWNCGAGGGLQANGALMGAMCDSFEQFYITGGGAKVMETHRYYVDPAGTQTRYMSVLGGLESPYALGLYLNAHVIGMGYGNNNNAPTSLNIDSSSMLLRSPSGYRYILLDDNAGDPSVLIKNGDSGNATRGYLKIASDGQLTLNTISLGFLLYNGATALNWSSSQTAMYLQSDNTYKATIDGNGVYLQAGNGAGAAQLQVRAGLTYSFQPVRPGSDKSASQGLGTSGGRWPWVATALAVGSLPACDSDSEGTMTVATAGSGVASILKVCMKNAANAYAWRDVYAP